MRKGEVTKQAILERAACLASQVGLEGLSIGRLAEDLVLSKSGLFAHFKSKETLQVQVLEHAAARFVEAVIKPALAAPRGEPRIRALYTRWKAWPQQSGMSGGCFFVAASAELDDRPGPARDLLVQQQRDWLDVIANVIRSGVKDSVFKKNTDPEQMAFELWGIMLAYHDAARLLGDPQSNARADTAFESFLLRLKK